MMAIENSGTKRQTAREPTWTELVEQIRRNDAAGMAALYRVFSRGVRFYLCRQLGPQDLDDRVHDTFITVAQAIQRGELREPERLMGYVRTIVRRHVAAHIEANVTARRRQIDLDVGLTVRDIGNNPEQTAILRENHEIAFRVLKSIGARDREILIRFYVYEEAPAKICSDMGLSDTQFRLLKSRAKARFGQIGRKKVKRRLLPLIFCEKTRSGIPLKR